MSHLPSESDNQVDADAGAADVREWFVTTDIRSIPASELRATRDSWSQWILDMLRYKVAGSKSHVAYAIELRRMIKGEAKYVPKRIIKHFDALKETIESLNFTPSFYANVPAIGPYSSAIMAMSRPDGEIHFLAWQVVTQRDGQIQDEGRIGLTTWLTDETSVVTVSPAKLPRACQGVDRRIVRSNDPAVLLKMHRQRLRKLEILPVLPEDLFHRVELDNRRHVGELTRRGVIRPATAAEVTRIRSEKRV